MADGRKRVNAAQPAQSAMAFCQAGLTGVEWVGTLSRIPDMQSAAHDGRRAMMNMLRKIYSPAFFDFTFAVGGAFGVVGLVRGMGRSVPAVASSDDPLLKGATLLVTIGMSVLLATRTTRLDQKLADDFLFGALSRSALIALVSFIFVAVMWRVLFTRIFGSFDQFTSIAIVMVAWSLAYLYTRIRGTGPDA